MKKGFIALIGGIAISLSVVGTVAFAEEGNEEITLSVDDSITAVSEQNEYGSDDEWADEMTEENSFSRITVADIEAASFDVEVFVRGEKLISDVPIRIIKGRTMVPIDSLLDAFDVVTGLEAGSIVIKGPVASGKNMKWMNMMVESNHISYAHFNLDFSEQVDDGYHREMDVSPIMIDGVCFVPIRFVAEELWYTVEWDNVGRCVNIFPYDANGTEK